MCNFNPECSGHKTDYGFIECSLERGCASGSKLIISFAYARTLGMRVKDICNRRVGYDQVDATGWPVIGNKNIATK